MDVRAFETIARASLGDMLLPKHVRDVFNSKLLIYQREAVNWLLDRFIEYRHYKTTAWCSHEAPEYQTLNGFILAFDMGLGKTVISCVFLRALFLNSDPQLRIRRAIICVPKTILLQWKQHICVWCPAVHIAIYHGPKRGNALAVATKQRTFILLTTYRTLSDDYETLNGICDEAGEGVMLLRGGPRTFCSESRYTSDSSDDIQSASAPAQPGVLDDGSSYANVFDVASSSSSHGALNDTESLTPPTAATPATSTAEEQAQSTSCISSLFAQTFECAKMDMHRTAKTAAQALAGRSSPPKMLLARKTVASASASAPAPASAPAAQRRAAFFDVLILDEATLLKNSRTVAARRLRKLRVDFKVALTGTPVMNSLREIWSIVDFLVPGYLCKQQVFRQEYDDRIQAARLKDARLRDRELGCLAELYLGEALYPLMLRRTKRLLSALLVTKTELILWTPLGPEQQRLYRAILSDSRFSTGLQSLMAARKVPLRLIHILRKICDHPARLSEADQSVVDERTSGLLARFCADATRAVEAGADVGTYSAKLAVLLRLCEHIRAQGDRVLVFADTTTMLSVIERALRARGYRTLRVDGSVASVAERESACNEFNVNDCITVFLLTIQVGAVGLNLTGANRVIIYGPSWNPLLESQAIARAYRIRQQKNVLVYRLVCCNCIEERMISRQLYKISLARLTVDRKRLERLVTKENIYSLFKIDRPDDRYHCETADVMEEFIEPWNYVARKLRQQAPEAGQGQGQGQESGGVLGAPGAEGCAKSADSRYIVERRFLTQLLETAMISRVGIMDDIMEGGGHLDVETMEEQNPAAEIERLERRARTAQKAAKEEDSVIDLETSVSESNMDEAACIQRRYSSSQVANDNICDDNLDLVSVFGEVRHVWEARNNPLERGLVPAGKKSRSLCDDSSDEDGINLEGLFDRKEAMKASASSPAEMSYAHGILAHIKKRLPMDTSCVVASTVPHTQITSSQQHPFSNQKANQASDAADSDGVIHLSEGEPVPKHRADNAEYLFHQEKKIRDEASQRSADIVVDLTNSGAGESPKGRVPPAKSALGSVDTGSAEEVSICLSITASSRTAESSQRLHSNSSSD